MNGSKVQCVAAAQKLEHQFPILSNAQGGWASMVLIQKHLFGKQKAKKNCKRIKVKQNEDEDEEKELRDFRRKETAICGSGSKMQKGKGRRKGDEAAENEY